MASLSQLARAGSAGVVGGALGWPMDTGVSLANLARAAYGYGGHKLGLLSTAGMPEPIDSRNVPGTSAHLSGLLGVGDSKAEMIAELIGGLLSPGPKASAVARAPKKAPLPMDEASRMARMREQGYDPSWFHGHAGQPFDAFDAQRAGAVTGTGPAGEAFFFTRSRADAQEFADNAAQKRGQSANVMKTAVAPGGRVANVTWPPDVAINSQGGQMMLHNVLLDARDAGFDSVLLRGAADSPSGREARDLLAVLKDRPGLGKLRDPDRARFDASKLGQAGLTLGLGGLGLGLLSQDPEQDRDRQ